MLEKATELGVGAIRPVVTRRCVADKLNPDRARANVTEAAEQCARTALPELHAPQKLDALLADWPEDRTLFFADEEGGVAAASAFAQHGTPAAILIGPEGGFSQRERDRLMSLPFVHIISLGPRILRADTAAVAAITLWQQALGDW